MNDQPLVSIIMIFLNAERFIQEAIESVLTQTYENWELLLVDDGSSDKSTNIARTFSDQDPKKVHYVEHPGHQNRGKSASRNLGINRAQGEYIAFLDADDVWLPDKLSQQVTILQAEPEAGMLYGLSQWWYSWTGEPEDINRDFIHDLGVPSDTLIQPPALLIPFFFSQRAAIPNPSNILVRHSVFEKINGFELSVSGLYEDQAFLVKVCIHFPVFTSNASWDRYRQHQDSSTENVQRRGGEYSERLIFLNWLSRYMEANGFRGTPVWSLLQKEVWFTRRPIMHLIYRKMQLNRPRLKELFLRISRWTLPAPLRSWLWARWYKQEYCSPVGWVRFGALRRLTPFSREFGFDRGQPIDRYYIEKFISKHQQDVHGHVLEIQEDSYTRKFGGIHIEKSDVLHIEPGHAGTTVVADLTNAPHILSESFDCIILTQTLQFIYDVHAALQTLYRILKPGGVLLATLPGITPISRYDMDKWGQYWGFTSLSARRLFEEAFPADQIQFITSGNVLSATALLYGMASRELRLAELDFNDPDYEVIIGIRAMKPVL